jgi:CRISPR-associated protein Cas6
VDAPPPVTPARRASAPQAEIRIDVSFPLKGPPVPLDHSYALYAALSEVHTELHGAEWLAVHPLRGEPQPDGTLLLDGDAALRLRIPPAALPRVLPLGGHPPALRVVEVSARIATYVDG